MSTARVPPVGRVAPWLTWLFGLLLLSALVLAVLHRGEERAFAALAARAEPAWLGVAALLQVVTYVCAASVWQRALASNGVHRSVASLLPLGLAKLFTDQAVPSAGVSGTVLVLAMMVRRRVERGVAIASMLTGLIAYYVAYAVALAVALLLLWSRHELSRWLVALASVFALFAAALPLLLVWLRGRSRRELPAWLRRVPVLREAVGALGEASEVRLWSIRSGLPCAALQLAIFVLDAATLLVLLRALAAPVPASLAFASFVIASAAGTLAWVPGGLGAFEGACVAMLHLHGVSLEPALAGTLLLRGFTFWLPMLPGLAIVRRELGRGGAEAHDVASR